MNFIGILILVITVLHIRDQKCFFQFLVSLFEVQILFRFLLINISFSKEYVDALIKCLCLLKIQMLNPSPPGDSIGGGDEVLKVEPSCSD